MTLYCTDKVSASQTLRQGIVFENVFHRQMRGLHKRVEGSMDFKVVILPQTYFARLDQFKDSSANEVHDNLYESVHPLNLR